jgi:hypothetical protein
MAAFSRFGWCAQADARTMCGTVGMVRPVWC